MNLIIKSTLLFSAITVIGFCDSSSCVFTKPAALKKIDANAGETGTISFCKKSTGGFNAIIEISNLGPKSSYHFCLNGKGDGKDGNEELKKLGEALGNGEGFWNFKEGVEASNEGIIRDTVFIEDLPPSAYNIKLIIKKKDWSPILAFDNLIFTIKE